MLDRGYYEGININDDYKAREDVLKLIDELEGDFDKRIKALFGPRKIKEAATDVRRSCRIMIGVLKEIQKKALMTKQDYKSDYS